MPGPGLRFLGPAWARARPAWPNPALARASPGRAGPGGAWEPPGEIPKKTRLDLKKSIAARICQMDII